MDKQIVRAPKPASGVAKRGMMGKTVKMNTNAKIVKVTICLLQENVQFG
jgi:hypothetical protein